MSDDELMQDLDRIDLELKRRKVARPFEPYAAWAMQERLAAISRYNERSGDAAEAEKRPTQP